MDKEKLFDYAVRIVEANLHGKGHVSFDFEKRVREQVSVTYKALADIWADVSKDRES